MDDMIPKPGSRWLHKNGMTYTVALVTNLASTKPAQYPATVVYFSDNDVWWSRPLERWHGSMILLPAQ